MFERLVCNDEGMALYKIHVYIYFIALSCVAVSLLC